MGALKANDPVRIAKLAAALRGRKRPRYVGRKISKALKVRPKSEETRRRLSETHKRRGTVPVKSRDLLWSAKEDELVRTLRPIEVARKSGRSLDAVYNRRRLLKLAARKRHCSGDRR